MTQHAPRTAQTPQVNRPQALSHIASLDGLRGVSVLAVVVFHVNEDLLPGGYLGVSVFFTLSGFLITRLLLRETGSTGTISLRQFYDRRFRRLLPAASVTIIATALWVLVVDRRSLLAEGDVRASALWHFNWHELSKEVAYGAADASALAHYWSLSIEEQFYFVYPIVLLALARTAPRMLRPTIYLLLAGSIPLAIIIDNYFNTFSRLFEILAGCAIAVVVSANPAVRKGVGTTVTVTAMLILTVAMFRTPLPSGGELPTLAIFATTGATLAIIYVSAASDGNGPLAGRGLRTLGTYSYSIYLWHWPILVLVDNVVVQLALTAALSVLSFQFVEQPLRRLRSDS